MAACIVNTSLGENVIRVKLREAMYRYSRASGERMTHERLSAVTGLSRSTLESLASREGYNTTLLTVDKLCRALSCQPGDILEYVPGENGT